MKGSNYPAVSADDIGDYRLLLPPTTEQRRIASILSSVDETIQATQVVIEQTRIVKQGVLRRLLSKGIGHNRFKQTEIGMIPETWRVVRVPDLLAKFSKAAVIKLKTHDYQLSGPFPIVDQGASLICGYTDQRSALCPIPSPIIVFGDHTRVFKYVDFPFVVGADGTQLLKPIENVDAKYLYYALSALELPSEGYSRHFRYLKEKNIALPSMREQEQIACCITSFDSNITVLKSQVEAQRALKAALMSDLLSGRVRVGSDLPLAAE
ncbi:hypothetical protein GCM10008965_48780 [Methylorubrum aminovorans]|nr:hypothetical protein GCM10025880_48380 [Methylorubrum aminovorans]